MRNLQTCATAQPLGLAVRDQVFPEHPCFPQLKEATDPKAMLELFRTHLKPASKPGQFIKECIPLRFRWRPDGSRCVLQYALSLLSGVDGQVSNLWVTVVLYVHPAEAESAWRRQCSACELRLIPRTLLPFEPLTLIPELRMLIYVFPYDRLLHSLPEIMRGPWAELQQSLLACFGSGHWQIQQQCTEPLRYRAENSAVFRFALNAVDSLSSRKETRQFYAKAYRTTYGEQVAQMFLQLYQRTAGAEEGFAVVAPLFYCPQRLCLVLDEARGHSLQDLLTRGNEADSLTVVRRIARALVAFNKGKVAPSVHHSARQQIEFLERAAVLLRWACPGSSSLIDHIVQTVSHGLQDGAHVPIFWDLKTDHVFLDDERVSFIDLDTVSCGDPARDAAHLAAHIACRIDVTAITARSARTMTEAFVEEYFSHVPANWRKQYELQFLIAVVEAACGLFKRQEFSWSGRAVAALEEAERLLQATCA